MNDEDEVCEGLAPAHIHTHECTRTLYVRSSLIPINWKGIMEINWFKTQAHKWLAYNRFQSLAGRVIKGEEREIKKVKTSGKTIEGGGDLVLASESVLSSGVEVPDHSGERRRQPSGHNILGALDDVGFRLWIWREMFLVFMLESNTAPIAGGMAMVVVWGFHLIGAALPDLRQRISTDVLHSL
jgi:hypothetical protein